MSVVRRVMLGLECLVLLGPALVLLVMAGGVAAVALLPVGPSGEGALGERALMLLLFGGPFLLGGVAVLEVARVAWATLRGRVVAIGRRSLVSAVVGVAGAVAGVASLFAVGDWKASPMPLLVVGVAVVPVVGLAVQLRWQQGRLARG